MQSRRMNVLGISKRNSGLFRFFLNKTGKRVFILMIILKFQFFEVLVKDVELLFLHLGKTYRSNEVM